MGLPAQQLFRVMAVAVLMLGCGRFGYNSEALDTVDSGLADAMSEPDAAVSNPPDASVDAGLPDYVLFLTRQTWRANQLGGLAGVDAKCQAEGAAMGGTYIAVLSNTINDARDRMPSSGRLFNSRAELILNDVANFLPLQDYRPAGIAVNLDAVGNAVTGLNPGSIVFWGADSLGVADASSMADDFCQDYSAAASGNAGVTVIDPEAGFSGGGPGCVAGNPHALLCIGLTTP